jgi:hypothetical protein
VTGNTVEMGGLYAPFTISTAVHVRPLRQRIDELSDLRHDLLLLDAASHLTVDYPLPRNVAESATVTECNEWLASGGRFRDWFQLTVNTPPVSVALTSPFDGTKPSPWSSLTGTPAGVPGQARPFLTISRPRGVHPGLRGPFVLLLFADEFDSFLAGAILSLSADIFLPEHKATILRLLDGILAALCLVLVLVLAALSQQSNALNFVLVMLAACRRYGRRSEPDGHTFLPMRRYQTSLGSCPY